MVSWMASNQSYVICDNFLFWSSYSESVSAASSTSSTVSILALNVLGHPSSVTIVIVGEEPLNMILRGSEEDENKFFKFEGV